jgi:hypothetical protein
MARWQDGEIHREEAKTLKSAKKQVPKMLTADC